MSKYYNDVNAVKENGILAIEQSEHISVPENQRLVMVNSNGIWDRAVDVTEKSEFDYFYSQYAAGMFLTCKLYIIDIGE